MASIQWTPAPTAAEVLAEVKANRVKAINHACESELNAVRNQYPVSEQLTWDHQENEARSYIKDNSSPTPLLSAISSARGLGLLEQATRVIDKASLYTQLAGAAIGKRQSLEDKINSASTVAEVETIVWSGE